MVNAPIPFIGAKAAGGAADFVTVWQLLAKINLIFTD
jgi:hypothetical protein